MTIDTSREAVERLAAENETLAQELRRLGGDDAEAAVATAGWNECVAAAMPALLAERDAALAEVARLSHAHAAERKLADDLIGIVEGIDGAMNHGTWRDDHGARLKDTPQWVAFYIAARRKE